jgi:hypothetical protein
MADFIFQEHEQKFIFLFLRFSVDEVIDCSHYQPCHTGLRPNQTPQQKNLEKNLEE